MTKQFKPGKGIAFVLPYDVNHKLEKYQKQEELKTGVKPTKREAIINILIESFKK